MGPRHHGRSHHTALPTASACTLRYFSTCVQLVSATNRSIPLPRHTWYECGQIHSIPKEALREVAEPLGRQIAVQSMARIPSHVRMRNPVHVFSIRTCPT